MRGSIRGSVLGALNPDARPRDGSDQHPLRPDLRVVDEVADQEDRGRRKRRQHAAAMQFSYNFV